MPCTMPGISTDCASSVGIRGANPFPWRWALPRLFGPTHCREYITYAALNRRSRSFSWAGLGWQKRDIWVSLSVLLTEVGMKAKPVRLVGKDRSRAILGCNGAPTEEMSHARPGLFGRHQGVFYFFWHAVSGGKVPW